jgi:chromosome segregation ATPase
MFEIVQILNDPLVWILIAMIGLTYIASTYWSYPLAVSIQEKLKESGEQVVKLQKVSEVLGNTIHDLEGKLQKQLDAVEGKVAHLTGDVGEVKREAHVIENHIGSLEVKTDVTVTKVDDIKHQIDLEAGELKRIEDQIKDSLGKVKNNTLHIQYLEDEVHGLERKLDIRVRPNLHPE